MFKFWKKGKNYKELYERQIKLTEKWEFKYNKLYNQLKVIFEEADR